MPNSWVFVFDTWFITYPDVSLHYWVLDSGNCHARWTTKRGLSIFLSLLFCLFFFLKLLLLIQGLFSYFLSRVYCSFQVDILCNDCHATGKAPFHIFGLKCSDCNSYNTRRTGSAPQEEESPTDLSSSDHWNWFVGVSCERNQMQIIQGFCYHLHLLLQFRYFHATCMMIFSVCSAITPIAWQHCHFF